MKTKAIHALATIFVATLTSHATTIWDLRTDWSDTVNPNGVWSYNDGNSPLPHVEQWGLDPSLSGWGPALPFWFRSPTTTSPEWQQGDVIVHTQDDYNGAGYGPANAAWTSPFTGNIDISGGVWMAADTGSIGGGLRGNQWNLYIRSNLVSTGSIGGGDPYSRTNPFSFELGAGGSAVLTNIQVSVGDVVKLEIVRTSVDGYFVGANLTITEKAIPAPRLNIRVSQVELCWDSATNFLYQLEYREALSTNSWIPLGSPILGTGARFCTNDAIIPGQPQRFYQLSITNAP